jgi:capsular polysaccharide biosynthesis protein
MAVRQQANGEAPKVIAPPPAVTLGRAMIWNWWIVVLAVIVCAAIGAGLALLRTPEYTATAKLTVGRIDISSPGALSGYAVAAEALATGYSRTVTARAVAEQVSNKTGISVKDVKDNVSATPIAKSPIFRIEATSPDADQAVRLANASSHALVRYTAKLSQSDPDSKRLYAMYEKAAVSLQRAKLKRERAEEDAGSPPSAAEEDAVATAQAKVEAAATRAKALEAAYTLSVQSQASTELIQILSPASEATSDKRSYLMILTLIGVVVGLLIGATLAFARESRWAPKPSH